MKVKRIVFGLYLALLHVPLLQAAGESAQPGHLEARVCIACHEEQYTAIKHSPHWQTADPRTPVNMRECATCHGELEEHVLGFGDGNAKGLAKYTQASTLSPPEQNGACLACHKEPTLLHWQGGGHDANDVGCVSCHSIHEKDRTLSRLTQADTCYTCHADTRAQAHKPYGHPLREGKMTCSNCHNPHGGPGDADLKTFSVNAVCYDCHAEKRGPFLWEHAPASENCVLCHSAHGSVNRGMLARRQPHICQSCHEPTAIAGNPVGPHARHSRLGLSFREPGAFDQGPEAVPGSKGISRFVLGEACTNCHGKVHGSNHPAGAKLTR